MRVAAGPVPAHGGAAVDFPIADLMDEGACYLKLLAWLDVRHRLQANGAAAVERSVLADDAGVEADEMYRAGGEKGPRARRPGRPAAPPGQRGPRAGQLGPRPPARARDRRASDPRAAA